MAVSPGHTPWQRHLLHQNISIAPNGVRDVAASAKPHAPRLCGQPQAANNSSWCCQQGSARTFDNPQ